MLLAALVAPVAQADPPADVFLEPQEPGPRLGLMALVGPGLRAFYDHRFELEEQMSELRLQAYGDLVFPYSEASLHADLRLFLLTFGASLGHHNEWRLLRFDPDYTPATEFDPGAGFLFGRDDAGQRGVSVEESDRSTDAQGNWVGPVGDTELSRSLRRQKEQNADIEEATWAFAEVRSGFIWPAQDFMLVSSAAVRYEDRPDVSYDWQLATVLDGGLHLRVESYAFFRDDSLGFVGPALRLLNVPRRRLVRDLETDVPTANGGTARVRTARVGDACQDAEGVPCEQGRQWELHYGLLGGLHPGWFSHDDLFLARVYTTWGFDNRLLGTHVFGAPLSLLFAYQVTVAP